VVATILFFDMYQYPLTEEELFRFLLFRKASFPELKNTLQKDPLLQKVIEKKDGLLFIKGRSEMREKRKKYEKIAESLWIKAEKIARILWIVPYIRLVAVSGSLARNAPNEKSDIDFLIITKSGRIWFCGIITALIGRLIKRCCKDCLNIM